MKIFTLHFTDGETFDVYAATQFQAELLVLQAFDDKEIDYVRCEGETLQPEIGTSARL